MLAYHRALGRQVAIKRIRRGRSDDTKALARLRREGQALASLDHPNVVTLYDMVPVEDDLYLVMEYVEGADLRALMRGASLSNAQRLFALRDIAAGLSYAAEFGILHRDVKPANVLVSRDGTCKLSDFGLAKILEQDLIVLTLAGMPLGTAEYMSPEQSRGATEIDQRSDVYSVGVLVYELFVGGVPFQRKGGDRTAVLEAHIHLPVPRPRDLVPEIPHQLERAILRALEKDPRKRQRSARALWEELESAADRTWPGWHGEPGLAQAVAATRVPPTLPAKRRASPRVGATGEASTVQDSAEGPPESLTDQLTASDTWGESSTALDTTVGDPAHDGNAPHRYQDVEQPGRRPAARPQVAIPTYRRARFGTIAAVAGVIALVAGAAVATYLFVARGATSPEARLAVQSIDVRVDPPNAQGSCPSAQFAFTASIKTNGARGTIRFQWMQPDGQLGPQSSVDLPAGTPEAIERLQFTYSRSGPTAGTAVLHVLSPDDIRSQPVAVRLTCP